METTGTTYNEEQLAQFDQIVIEEVNVKKVCFNMADTDKGSLALCLNKGAKLYHFELDNSPVTEETNIRLRESGLIMEVLKNRVK